MSAYWSDWFLDLAALVGLGEDVRQIGVLV